MERLIYCPSNEQYNSALLFSKQNGLPILIGDNERTKNIFFDRKNVGVVSIPEFNYIKYLPTVKFGLHQIIYYENEFINNFYNIKLYINNEEIFPVFKEARRAKYLFLPTEVGNYSGRIVVDNEQIEEFNFDVSVKITRSN